MNPIIDNWRDLPLGTYLDILELQRTEQDELPRQAAVIAALTGMDAADVLQLPLAEYKRLRAASEFLGHECPDDLLRTADRYGCPPFTLIPVKDFDKLTVAQYVDFQTFAKDPERHFPELLSVLLVPEGKRYCEGYDPKDVQHAIRGWLNVADALGLMARFFAWSSTSMRNSLDYSRVLAGAMPEGPEKATMLARIRETEAAISEAAGDGSLP